VFFFFFLNLLKIEFKNEFRPNLKLSKRRRKRGREEDEKTLIYTKCLLNLL